MKVYLIERGDGWHWWPFAVTLRYRRAKRYQEEYDDAAITAFRVELCGPLTKENDDDA